ncbi:DUF2147 domain-containing protein [Pedobacter sp. SD-b]|uniref:DUF2147 domain-containing protein n=1 Tax=Pedobacter segetis TaxID=2793069 RepID=A0ABS1BJW4_9SPHI|nr:DUF2147 domain-containing protein [Pedobacter segetis]MBK0383189.1 DUF2147 domain-containing protein [Pedobacter segetis]
MGIKTLLITFVMLFPRTEIKSALLQENLILGKWISVKKNVIVDVYKENNLFRAKVIWFSDADNPAKPMATRTDWRNPDANLRSRKLLGMDILKNLTYKSSSKRWEDGLIYDPLSGREWSSVVYFNDQKQLEVKGYWHFEFISKTMIFNRLKD